jgi:hypothetical protein
MLGSLSGLTAQTKEATDALTRAKLPMLGNIDWYSTQNAGSVTTGTRSGGLIDGASQNVTYASVKDGAWTQTLTLDNVGNGKTVVGRRSVPDHRCLRLQPADQGATALSAAVHRDHGRDLGRHRHRRQPRPVAHHQPADHHLGRVSDRGLRRHLHTAAPDDNAAIWMGDATPKPTPT